MTIFSAPWPETDPQVGDGREYTAADWDLLWEILHACKPDHQGVVWGVWNNLEVTSPGANQLSVNTGAALVKGHVVWNDAAINLAPASAPEGETRKDYVLLRCDWTGGVGTQYTVRVVIKQGTAGALPSLQQDDDVCWEIPLYSYVINDAGAISSLISVRKYADTGRYNRPLKGQIIMWSGSMSGHYPVDPETGAADKRWHTCNGDTHNGVATPNLLDRFIVAAGSSYGLGGTGGAATIDLSHTHDMSHVHDLPAKTGDIDSAYGIAVDVGTEELVLTAGTPSHLHDLGGQTYAGDPTITGEEGEPSQSILPPYYALIFLCFIGDA